MAIFEYFTSSFHHLDSNVPEVEDSPPCHAHTWTCGAVFFSFFSLLYIHDVSFFFSLLGERPRPGILFSFIPHFYQYSCRESWGWVTHTYSGFEERKKKNEQWGDL